MPGFRTRRRSVAICSVAVALATAPETVAGTVSLEEGVLSYRSAPGEIDAYEAALGPGYVEVRYDQDSSRDPSGRLSPGAGCVELTPPFSRFAAVRCPLGAGVSAPRLQVELGDRADHFASTSALTGEFDGGRGNDTISREGVPRTDEPEGGSRTTVIFGGSGHDYLTAFNRAGPVRMFGGLGADKLEGSNAGDRLSGGPGGDDVNGFGGADVIDPGPGVDSAGGDDGDDVVRARDGRLDSLSCWAGRDTLVLDRFDFYWEDRCERVRRRGAARSVLVGAAVYLKADGHDENELALAFSCPYDGPRICNPTFRISGRRGLVLRPRGQGLVSKREFGGSESTWNTPPRVLESLSRWARVTMVARDTLGRSYRQTLVCQDGMVPVEFYEGDSFSPAASDAIQLAQVGGGRPLVDSRSCFPPVLNPWVL